MSTLTTCPVTPVTIINSDEYIGDSLPAINNNFKVILDEAQILCQKLDNLVNVRTFFYYGPNTPVDYETNFDEQFTIPSNNTIQTFVTSPSGLNLPEMSEEGDIAWVIYQRTGWAERTINNPRSGSGRVPYVRNEQRSYQQKIRISRSITVWYTVAVTYYADYTWTAPADSLLDKYREYCPIFVVYKLTYKRQPNNTLAYTIDTGFPKFTKATTSTSNFWNLPTLWNTY